MKYLFFSLFLFISLLHADYMDNHTCSECHEKIYEEFESSQHAKTYFTDELHRKVADAADPKRYACATCHMPAADNLKDLVSGKARPDPRNKTHTDAISCYFCHTIAYVKKAHRHNVNVKSRQAEGFKPTLYGRLSNPDESDKHSSVQNPIYAANVCSGCHSHKLNDNNVTIFRAMTENQKSISCIECHMPEIEGGAEKMDKRARGHHASHRFPGIHDAAFRKKGIDINVTAGRESIQVTLMNRMDHPLIIQPARAKFLKITIRRGDTIIWQNYRKEPSEDTQGYFAYHFKKDGKKIIVPATATEGSVHNLDARATLQLEYKTPPLQHGDVVRVALYVRLAKSDCYRVIDLKERSLQRPQLIKEISKRI